MSIKTTTDGCARELNKLRLKVANHTDIFKVRLYLRERSYEFDASSAGVLFVNRFVLSVTNSLKERRKNAEVKRIAAH